MKEFKIIENKEIKLLNKRGRPQKKNREKIKDKMFIMKLDKEEFLLLEKLAENESLTKTDFVKNKIFEGIKK